MQLPDLDILNYKLLRRLGEGGTSWVFLAEQLRPKRKVAVKIVPPQPGVDEALLESLRLEGDIAAQFHHDNLVTVYDCGIVDDHYFLAMEFLPGGDLQSRMAKGVSLQDATRITAQIAAGLSQLHARGMVHRDVKPGNVMFHENGRAVLVDFAIARPFAEMGLMTQQGFVTGTPLYMSPEQFQRKSLSARSDLYSLGVMFYQMLVGSPPFDGADPIELRDAHLRDPVRPLPPHLSRFQPIIDKLLAKEPDQRYASAGEVITALNRLSQQMTGLTPLPMRYDVLNVADDSGAHRFAVSPGRKRWLYGGTGVLAAAAVAAYLGFGAFAPGPKTSRAVQPSVAVLPFADMSAQRDQQYFAEGLADTLLNSLAQVEGLKVAARTSSFSFRDTDADVRAIARRLGVNAVLEGSVQKAGNRVRVIAQLINAGDGTHLWSQNFDRDLEDIFAVQDEIAAAIAGALKVALVRRDAAAPQLNASQIRAYDLYLLGRHYWHQRTASSIRRSIALFEEAIELNPEFVQSYTGLADAYNLLTVYGDLSGPSAAEMMAEPVARARELDEGLAEVHTSYGAMKENLGDLNAAELAYRKAIEINDNYALAYMWLGNVLIYQGRLQEARQVYSHALTLDPLNVAVTINMGRTEVYRGDLERGLEYIERARESNPGSALTYETAATWLRQYGRLEQALESARRAEAMDPEGAQNVITLATILIDLGEDEEAAEWIAKAARHAPDNWQFAWLKGEYDFFTDDPEALIEFAERRLDALSRQPSGQTSMDWKVASIWRGIGALMAEDYAAAVDHLDAVRSESSQYHLELGRELTALAMQVVAQRRLGQPEEAKRTLRRAAALAEEGHKQGWATPNFLVQEAALINLEGDSDRALAGLARAVAAGFVRYRVLERDPAWSALHDDERFRRVVASLKERVMAMKKTIFKAS